MSAESNTTGWDKAEEREAGWFEDACALVRKLVPAAEPYEVQHAAERIVAQLQQVWMHHGRRPAVEEAAKLASQQLGTLKAVAAKKAKQANLSNTSKDENTHEHHLKLPDHVAPQGQQHHKEHSRR